MGKEIAIYQVRDINLINTLDEASENYKVFSTMTILNESKKAFELIGHTPLFIHKDKNGKNYASLPGEPIIHGKWIAKSQMKYLGITKNGKEAFVLPTFVNL